MTPFPASAHLLSALFVLCLFTMGAGAVVAVVSSRLIRSVCGLAVCAIGLAGLYYFLHSPFLALMEILIYVGAVCVMIVFAVMLAETEEAPRLESGGAALIWTGLAWLIVASILYGLLTVGFRTYWAPPPSLANDGSIAAIGRALLTTHSLAFELISLALLIAIVGALAIARAGRTAPAATVPLDSPPLESTPRPPHVDTANLMEIHDQPAKDEKPTLVTS